MADLSSRDGRIKELEAIQRDAEALHRRIYALGKGCTISCIQMERLRACGDRMTQLRAELSDIDRFGL